MNIYGPKHEDNVGSSANTPDSLKTQLDYLWKVHDYTNNYIRFSDTKAALVIAFASGFIASLVTHKVHHPLRMARFALKFEWAYTSAVIGSCAAFSLLAMSILFAILSILPRLRPRPLEEKTFQKWVISVLKWMKELVIAPPHAHKGPIYWGNVLAYHAQKDYWAAIQEMGQFEQAKSIADHLFILAGISNSKFRLVNLSVFLAVVGSILASVLIIIKS